MNDARKGCVQMAAGYEGICQGSQIEIAPGVSGDIEELKRAVKEAEAKGARAIFFPQAEAKVSFTTPDGERVE
jgi:hypothetical protein